MRVIPPAFGDASMQKETGQITEKQLAENFEKVQREVAEQIRKYAREYPELDLPRGASEQTVRQPVYSYEVHAVS